MNWESLRAAREFVPPQPETAREREGRPRRHSDTFSSVMEEGVKLHTKGRVTHGASTDIDGDYFFFKGGSTGIIKFLEPMNPLLNYYEYEIINRGQEASIGIGVGERGYPMTRMPGWNRNSCGYHADDGKLYHENGLGSVFGPTCTDGDRMGCGVDFTTDCGYGYVNVFFTKNGKQVGNVVRMKRPTYGLYPLIGLHSRGEKVRYLGHRCCVPEGNAEPMDQDDSPSCMWLRSNGVKFTEGGVTLEYTGTGGDVQDVGMAQARYPLTRTNHYFEMEVLGTGSLGALAIGLAKTTYPLHRHPGWNPGAVGYHADDGKLFKGRGHGDQFGPTCTEGDTMGCGIVFSPHSTAEDGGSDSESGNETSEEDAANVDNDFGEDLFSDESDYSDYSDDLDFLLHGALMRRHAQARARPQRQRTLVKQHSRTSSENKCIVYFTKNGERVGETECEVPKGGFFPVVAMLSHGEKLKVDLCPLSG